MSKTKSVEVKVDIDKTELVYVNGCPRHPYINPKFEEGDYVFVTDESKNLRAGIKCGYVLFASWSLLQKGYVYGIDPLTPLDVFDTYTPESELYAMKNGSPQLSRFSKMLYALQRGMTNPKKPIEEMKNKIKLNQERTKPNKDFSIETLPETKKLKIKKEVKRLVEKYPNDLELGKAVRSLIIQHNERKQKVDNRKK
jgi:hypothetical protein